MGETGTEKERKKETVETKRKRKRKSNKEYRIISGSSCWTHSPYETPLLLFTLVIIISCPPLPSLLSPPLRFHLFLVFSHLLPFPSPSPPLQFPEKEEGEKKKKKREAEGNQIASYLAVRSLYHSFLSLQPRPSPPKAGISLLLRLSPSISLSLQPTLLYQ